MSLKGLDQNIWNKFEKKKKSAKFSPTYVKILPGPACKEALDNLGKSFRSCPVQGGGHISISIFRRLVGIGALA